MPILLKRFSVIAMLTVTLLAASSAASSAAIIEHRLFMKEFAEFVKGKLDDEPKIRQDIKGFVARYKDRMTGGFGKHPELDVYLYEMTGLDGLNCMTGRSYELLTHELNEREVKIFYENSSRLAHWALIIATEEAANAGAYKPITPLRYRSKDDVPMFIVQAMKADITPYLGMELTKEDMKGQGFKALLCK